MKVEKQVVVQGKVQVGETIVVVPIIEITVLIETIVLPVVVAPVVAVLVPIVAVLAPVVVIPVAVVKILPAVAVVLPLAVVAVVRVLLEAAVALPGAMFPADKQKDALLPEVREVIALKALPVLLKETAVQEDNRNHTIFRHANFIGCLSADKIKMPVREYFCFNIPVYRNMAEEPSCRSPYHEEYIQTSVSGNSEGLCRSTYSFLSERR